MTNSMVVGGDLYQIVKSFTENRFEPVVVYYAALKLQYPVYFITLWSGGRNIRKTT